MKVTNLSKIIDKTKIIENITFTLNKGEIIGLIGRNGVGKTTLFRTIGFHYVPDSGKIIINNTDLSEDLFLKEKIFYLDNQYKFLDSVNLKKIGEFYQLAYSTFDEEKYSALLTKHLLPITNKYKNMSKGMQALFNIILAISTNADYLLLDEPFDGLDFLVKKQVIQLLIHEVSLKNCGVIISSHNLSELENLIDKALILKNKQIIEEFSLENNRESKKKIQMVFPSKKLPTIVKENCTIISVQGRVVIGIFENLTDDLQQDILALHPALFEELPLTLEDMFALNLTDEQDYNFFS